MKSLLIITALLLLFSCEMEQIDPMTGIKTASMAPPLDPPFTYKIVLSDVHRSIGHPVDQHYVYFIEFSIGARYDSLDTSVIYQAAYEMKIVAPANQTVMYLRLDTVTLLNTEHSFIPDFSHTTRFNLYADARCDNCADSDPNYYNTPNFANLSLFRNDSLIAKNPIKAFSGMDPISHHWDQPADRDSVSVFNHILN